MRKKKITIIPETTKTVYIECCDWCDNRPKKGRTSRCTICGRVSCGKHNKNFRILNYDDGDYFDDDYFDDDDFHEYCCHECWEIGEPFREAIASYKETIEILRKDWHKKAKEEARRKERRNEK